MEERAPTRIAKYLHTPIVAGLTDSGGSGERRKEGSSKQSIIHVKLWTRVFAGRPAACSIVEERMKIIYALGFPHIPLLAAAARTDDPALGALKRARIPFVRC